MGVIIGLAIAAVWRELVLFITHLCGVNNLKEDEGKTEK